MSTAVVAVESPGARVAVDQAPGLPRLVGVELRKMVDTRAGFWLQLGTLGAMIAVVVLNIVFGKAADQTFQDMLWSATWPATILLPIVGILLVSSEWSQRTSLITFTLVPRRLRVLGAKVGAALVLSTAALVVSLALALVGTLIAHPDIEGTWSLPPEMLGQAALYASVTMLIGLAFGAALLSSAPAIVLYFVLPIGWTLLASIPRIESVGRWVDTGRSLGALSEHALSATEWARAGTTIAVWMLLPLLAGAWRINRSEVQ